MSHTFHAPLGPSFSCNSDFRGGVDIHRDGKSVTVPCSDFIAFVAQHMGRVAEIEQMNDDAALSVRDPDA